MLKLGQGKLMLDFKGFRLTDGVNYFYPLSLSLIHKLLRKKNRGDTVMGEWVIAGKFIVVFKKKKYVHSYTDLKENYKREDIKLNQKERG